MAFPDAILGSATPTSFSFGTPLSISLTASFIRLSPPSAAPSRIRAAIPSSLCIISSKPGPVGFLPLSLTNGRAGALLLANAGKRSSAVPAPAGDAGKAKEGEQEEEEEVELSWVEEKVEDLTQFTSTAIRSIPGPRVGDGDLPWLLAVPLGYMAISLVIAVVKTIRRETSSKGKRKRQVGKNAWLVDTLSEYLPEKREELDSKALSQIAKKCGFDTEEVLRKYIRYAMNERPFDPELVKDLIHLRNVSMLDDKTVAEVLNEVSRRIVKAMGPVIVDTTGFTEKGLKRKVAVQGLFSKILYLAELDEFCDMSSLSIKEIFGVTDEDANLIRIETLSGEAEVESLEQLVQSPSKEALDDEET